jgi:signal transduction histidine kinase
MRQRTASRLAWALWALIPMTLVGSVLIVLLSAFSVGDELPGVFIVPILLFAFGTVGALIASRRPGNAIGWILLGTGVAWAIVGLSDTYAGYAAAAGLTETFLARLADWLNLWFYAPALFLPITLLLLLFPTGSPLSRRWRLVVWVAVMANAVLSFCVAFDPVTTASDTRFLRSNPFGIAGAHDVILRVNQLAWWLSIGAFIASGVGIAVRLRRSRDEERAQMKWLTASGVFVVLALFVVIFLGSAFGWESDPAAQAVIQAVILSVFTTIPIAAGIAILRYRLYEIDVVINRTVVYATLAAIVTLIYVAIVVGIGTAVGSGGSPFLSAVAAAIVALLFQPARRWAQRFANRLVYGRRASPYEVLSTFSDRLSDAFSVEDVLPRMAHMIADSTGSNATRIWLAAGEELRPVASWPADAPHVGSVQGIAALPDRGFEVRHQGELLGAITVATDPREPITPTQVQLIENLAAQAGLVLRNVRLVEDLRESRRRIVAAQDARAKKLERDIHDGAQQQLVALAVKLGLVERLVGADPERAVSMLAEAKAEANDALDDLRDLARGIYPPLLADKGLAAALEGQARKSPIPVEIHPDGIGRYPQEMEAAVYFSCLEALQNVAKYSGATKATVRLAQADGGLTFEVSDDGRGFDPAVVGHGTGLQGIADRLAALGGEVTIRSAPGDGTTVAGRLPLETSP